MGWFRQHARWWVACLGLGVVLTLAGPPNASASERDRRDVRKLKAAFIYNFVKFVQWPDDAFADRDSPITIGVMGDEPMRVTLARTVRARQVRGRSLRVVRLDAPPEDDSNAEDRDRALAAFVQQTRRCHLVYFGPKNRRRVERLLAHVELPEHVLTVGDGRGYLDQPTMLDLLMKGDERLVFFANHDRIQRAPFKVSSQLLRLARAPR